MPSFGKKANASLKALLNIQRWTVTTWLVAVMMVVGAVLRFWNIPATVQFLGDQGRDAIVVARIFQVGDPVFIGPVTSTGNMYLGPLYYYFMLPFLWLSYPSPLGPVYAVAAVSLLALLLIYRLGRQLVGERAALIAMFFMTFSSIVLYFSRFSWNPNLAPFVSIIMIYAVYKAWKGQPWYWVLVSGCFSVLIQLHYVILLSGLAAGVIWLVSIFEQKGWALKRVQLQKLLAPTVIALLVLVASLTPLILFDLKHDNLNARALMKMVTHLSETGDSGQVTPAEKAWQVTTETHGRSLHILFEMMIGKHRTLNTTLLIFILATLVWLLKQGRQRPTFQGEVVLVTFLITGIIGTAFYPGSLFDHYIAYLFPVTFLIYGVVLNALYERSRLVGMAAGGIFTLIFLAHNLATMPFKPVDWNVKSMEQLSQTIYQRVQPGEKYNLVLLSDTGDIDAQNYRYFLSTTDRPPVPTERRGEIETLFIINEDRKLKKVTDSPIYEIVVFPDKNPKEVYNGGGGIEVTVLRKSQ
jgi:4-amino-4-deoxy-L-arabinose transferase-like glycosyltransferase